MNGRRADDPRDTDSSRPDGAELAAGLVESLNRANANTQEAHRANATADALVELLTERGILEPGSIEERREQIGEDLRHDYLRRGMGVRLQETRESKYDIEEAPKIDCASRLPLCKGACCKLSFALTPEDVEEGIVRWDLRRPYIVAQAANGRCVHQEEDTCRCAIYRHRPATCRTYDCRQDRRIWVDFEKRIPNPRLDEPDWTSLATQDPATTSSDTGDPAGRDGDDGSGWQSLSLDASEGPDRLARLKAVVNRALDRTIRPRLRVFGRPRPAYGVFVCLGGLMAIAATTTVAWAAGLSSAVMAGVLIAAAVAAYYLGIATRAITGVERFAFFHYEVGVLLTGAAAIWILQQPLVPYLALVAFAMAIAQAIGRVGCLMAGCCHGTAADWGARYGDGHVRTGFPRQLVGVRLVPVPLLESIFLLGLTCTLGAALLTARLSPGSVLVHLLVWQAIVRFGLETIRGDLDRPRVLGLKESQWTAAAIVIVVLGLGWWGGLPWSPLLAGLAGVEVLLFGIVSARRRFLGGDPSCSPEQRTEVAALAGDLGRHPPEMGCMRTGETTGSLRLSLARLPTADVERYDLAFSAAEELSTDAARRVARRLLAQWPAPVEATELLASDRGIYHLILEPSSRVEELGEPK